MEPIIWTEEFSVGVEVIDKQHKKLIAILPRLITDTQVSINSKTVSILLSDMTQYIEEHFQTEEFFRNIVCHE